MTELYYNGFTIVVTEQKKMDNISIYKWGQHIRTIKVAKGYDNEAFAKWVIDLWYENGLIKIFEDHYGPKQINYVRN